MTDLNRRRAIVAAALAAAAVGAQAQNSAADELFTAVQRNNVRALRALLQRGVNPNLRNAKGQTALALALQVESIEAFDELLAARNTNVNLLNAQGESALMMAAIKGRIDAMRSLMARGADVNKTGWTPLHYAASCTEPQAVQAIALLIEHHAYIDAGSPNGTTPLMMAAQYGTSEAVRLLIDEGADPSIANQKSLTAVDFARFSERRDVIDMVASALRSRQPNQGKW